MAADYRYVLIETYRAAGEPSKHRIRARPLAGQLWPVDLRVECSAKMRREYDEGTVFKVRAKLKGGDRDPHLYTSWQWEYEILPRHEAEALIRSGHVDAVAEELRMAKTSMFDHRADGLERTDWFLFERHLPERMGTYEVCAWKDADVARCRWDGKDWWADDRLAPRLAVGFWRGVTRGAYVRAQEASKQGQRGDA